MNMLLEGTLMVDMLLEWIILDIGGIFGAVVFFGGLLMTVIAGLAIVWATDAERNVKIEWQLVGITVCLGLLLFVFYAFFAGLNIYTI